LTEENSFITVVYEDENVILFSNIDEDVFNENEYSKEYRKSKGLRVVRADVLLWQQILWLKRQLKKEIQYVIDPLYEGPVSLKKYIEDNLECLKK
jgi:hypothetical protein